MNPDSTFAGRAINFFLNLPTPNYLPRNISALNPYLNDDVKSIVESFYKKYFFDNNKRILALGINPGRFGGGITGVSFTDPVALEIYCDIKNRFQKKKEISSAIMYNFINKFGGANDFYSKFFISPLYPLALIKDGLNYNYYDEKKLFNLLKPFIIETVKAHIEFGSSRDYVICLGRKNSIFFEEINKENNFFKRIIVLDHPRYIMQYKRKYLDKYLSEYLSAFKYT